MKNWMVIGILGIIGLTAFIVKDTNRKPQIDCVPLNCQSALDALEWVQEGNGKIYHYQKGTDYTAGVICVTY